MRHLRKSICFLQERSIRISFRRYETESGDRQKALALKPQIILMDELFASLDAMTRNHLQEELMKLHQKEKVTVISLSRTISRRQSAWEQGILVMAKQGGIKMDVQIRFRNRSHRHRKAMDRCGICLTKHCIRKVNKGKNHVVHIINISALSCGSILYLLYHKTPAPYVCAACRKCDLLSGSRL